MFCLAANYNAPHNNTPMLGVHAHGAAKSVRFEMDSHLSPPGDR